MSKNPLDVEPYEWPNIWVWGIVLQGDLKPVKSRLRLLNLYLIHLRRLHQRHYANSRKNPSIHRQHNTRWINVYSTMTGCKKRQFDSQSGIYV